MKLKVRRGEKFPADGIVEFGTSSVDESMITGESSLILKSIGRFIFFSFFPLLFNSFYLSIIFHLQSPVIGGTLNQTGVLNVRVTRVGTESTLSQIISLVESAQTSKGIIYIHLFLLINFKTYYVLAPIQAIADKVASYFIPLVVVLSLVTFFVWFIIIYTVGPPEMFQHESSYFFVCVKIRFFFFKN